MAFDVEEDVSEGFYKAKATLANGNDKECYGSP